MRAWIAEAKDDVCQGSRRPAQLRTIVQQLKTRYPWRCRGRAHRSKARLLSETFVQVCPYTQRRGHTSHSSAILALDPVMGTYAVGDGETAQAQRVSSLHLIVWNPKFMF